MTRDELLEHIKEELTKVLPGPGNEELSGVDFDQAETVLQELVDNGIEALDAEDDDEDEDSTKGAEGAPSDTDKTSS